MPGIDPFPTLIFDEGQPRAPAGAKLDSARGPKEIGRNELSRAVFFMPPDPRPERTEQVRWFANEVHPHESALRAFLRVRFPAVRDVDDIVQESFLRVWRTRASRPVQYAKAFLFKVASHLAIDQSRQVSTLPIDDVRGVDIIQEGAGVVGGISAREKVKLLAAAIDDLPSRCREVVVLRKFEGVPQKEVAARLRLSEKTVEAHLARGIARIKVYMRARGMDQYYSVDESS